MTQTTFKLQAFWDAEAQVWVATSEDVPGLTTEASTIEALTQKLRQMIPELILLNNIVSSGYAGFISFELTSQRVDRGSFIDGCVVYSSVKKDSFSCDRNFGCIVKIG